MIGAVPNSDWLRGCLALDAKGFVLTGADLLASGEWRQGRAPDMLETSVPGIFAAGDVRAGSVKRVAAGVGEGAMAVSHVHRYLAEEAVASPQAALAR